MIILRLTSLLSRLSNLKIPAANRHTFKMQSIQNERTTETWRLASHIRFVNFQSTNIFVERFILYPENHGTLQ